MRSSRSQSVALAAVLALVLAGAALAAPGSLDTTFSGDGKRATDFFGSIDVGRAVAIQADGKIVVAGDAWNGMDHDFAVVRYKPNGALDATFSGDGKKTTDFFGSSDTATGVAIQDDGKIVVAGVAQNGATQDFALVRYKPNGALDTTFGGDGRKTTDFFDDHDVGNAVALQADGKILVVGYALQDSDFDLAVARYGKGGGLDPTFSGDGKQTTDIDSGSVDWGFSVAIQGDGKIVVGGVAGAGSSADFTVARYKKGGAPDTTFGGTGFVTTDFFGSADAGHGLAIQGDGKIVLTGTARGGSDDLAVARYKADGAPDTTFNGDGKQTTDIDSGSEDAAWAVAIQGDGKIVVGGVAGAGSSADFTVARYKKGGAPDTTFGGIGFVTTDFFGSGDNGYTVAIQGDGKIVVAGAALGGSEDDFAVARYGA